MEFLFLDNKIAVCIKPRGVLSTDVPEGMPSLIRTALGEPDAPVYTVHRLDAPVGGLMVFARTRRAASDLGRAIQSGAFCKEYLAVLRGVPEEKQGALRDRLRRDTLRRRTEIAREGEEGQPSELRYAVIGEREGLSLVRIERVPGRTHQIRCQFSARGLPLWGDRKYGLPGETGPIALWSRALSFPHPVTGERLSFAAEPPAQEPWTLFAEVRSWT